MRLTKPEQHKHFEIKFVKKYSLIPRKVQNHWIMFEHYYVGYQWDFVNLETREKVQLDYWRKNPGRAYTFDDTLAYSRKTHKWHKFPISSNRLEEDEEVQDWLMKNSPLSLALKE